MSELEDKGVLGKARNRKEISDMLGLGYNYGAGYSWVSNMISRGHLKETLLGFNKYNQPEYEYHIINKPNYEPYKIAKKAKKNKVKKTKATKVDNEVEALTTIKTQAPTSKMVIRYRDLTIELEQADYTLLENIIKNIIK